MKPSFLLEPVVRPESFTNALRIRGSHILSIMIKNSLLTLFVLTGVGLSELKAQRPTATIFPAQAEPALQMVVDYGGGKQKQREIRRDLVDPVGLPVNRPVSITLKFSPTRAGQRIALSLLDGGQLRVQEAPVVGPNGKVTFEFSPGSTPGLYRLQVYAPEQYELRLYAFDPNAPARSRRN